VWKSLKKSQGRDKFGKQNCVLKGTKGKGN